MFMGAKECSLRCWNKSKTFLINHTPLRGEQQATIYYDRRRCDDMATINEFDKRIVKGFPQWQEQQ